MIKTCYLFNFLAKNFPWAISGDYNQILEAEKELKEKGSLTFYSFTLKWVNGRIKAEVDYE
jgi:hypothetical protein